MGTEQDSNILITPVTASLVIGDRNQYTMALQADDVYANIRRQLANCQNLLAMPKSTAVIDQTAVCRSR